MLNDSINFVDSNGYAKGGKQNILSSEFKGMSDEEVSKRARDKSLSPNDRRKAQKEEKARNLRNKQKRKNQKGKGGGLNGLKRGVIIPVLCSEFPNLPICREFPRGDNQSLLPKNLIPKDNDPKIICLAED